MFDYTSLENAQYSVFSIFHDVWLSMDQFHSVTCFRLIFPFSVESKDHPLP